MNGLIETIFFEANKVVLFGLLKYLKNDVLVLSFTQKNSRKLL